MQIIHKTLFNLNIVKYILTFVADENTSIWTHTSDDGYRKRYKHVKIIVFTKKINNDNH